MTYVNTDKTTYAFHEDGRIRCQIFISRHKKLEGKFGWAEQWATKPDGKFHTLITLDDGTVVSSDEATWKPLREKDLARGIGVPPVTKEG
jgi:hypothetical protein